MKTLAIALSLIPMAVPAPLLAQTMPVADAIVDTVEAGAHERLYRTLRSAMDLENELDAIARAMNGQFAANPFFAAVEVENPGFIEELTGSARPVLRDHAMRVTALAEPGMIELLRTGLTSEEAVQADAFYSSQIGQQIMKAANGSINFDETLDTAIREKTITADNVERGLHAAGNRGFSQLSPTDQARANREAAANAGVVKFVSLMPQIAQLRARFENEPMLPADDARMRAAMMAVFDKYGVPTGDQ